MTYRVRCFFLVKRKSEVRFLGDCSFAYIWRIKSVYCVEGMVHPFRATHVSDFCLRLGCLKIVLVIATLRVLLWWARRSSSSRLSESGDSTSVVCVFFFGRCLCETAHASRQRCACVLFSVRARFGDRQQQVLCSCNSLSILHVAMCGISIFFNAAPEVTILGMFSRMLIL